MLPAPHGHPSFTRSMKSNPGLLAVHHLHRPGLRSPCPSEKTTVAPRNSLRLAPRAAAASAGALRAGRLRGLREREQWTEGPRGRRG